MYSRLQAILATVLGLKSSLAYADTSKGAGGTDGGSGGTGGDNGDGNDGGAGNDQTVSYDTHQKMLKELKAAKRALKEQGDKIAAGENDRMQAEGKKDELIAKLKGDNEKLTKAQKDNLTSFINAGLNSQVREIAATMGCVDLDAVGQLADLSDIEVDTKTFKADKDELSKVLEGLKKAKPYLFNKPAPKINPKLGGSTATVNVNGEKKGIKELSTQQIKDQLTEIRDRKAGLSR